MELKVWLSLHLRWPFLILINLVKKKESYYIYVNHSFLFLITSDSIKDSDYNNLIIF